MVQYNIQGINVIQTLVVVDFRALQHVKALIQSTGLWKPELQVHFDTFQKC